MDVWRATRLFGGLSLLVLGRTSRQRKHYRVKSPIVVSPNQLSRARVSDPRGKCFLNRTSDSTTSQTVPFVVLGGSFSFIIESNQIKAFMTFQQSINLTDTPRTEYNGWSDWTTWNCALWIGGDEGLYNIARSCEDWFDFILEMQEFGMDKTPDGAKWTEADYDEMTECINEL